MLSLMIIVVALQWGRNFFVTEIFSRGRKLAIKIDASMGP